MSRLVERMEDRLRAGRSAHTIILVMVGAIVLLRIVVYTLTTAFLMLDDIELYRIMVVIGTALAAVLDVVMLIFVWILFATVGRVEREAERVQAFMDNVYRKMLKP